MIWPKFQLTHLLRGATIMFGNFLMILQISTHAPLARCDAYEQLCNLGNPISTHAPLARCDVVVLAVQINVQNFNSRTSCEVRHSLQTCPVPAGRFQLTHLLRGATAIYCSTFISQTHHLVRGGQVNQIIDLSGVKYCPVLARTGNDFGIIHGSLKHYKIIGPSGS